MPTNNVYCITGPAENFSSSTHDRLKALSYGPVGGMHPALSKYKTNPLIITFAANKHEIVGWILYRLAQQDLMFYVGIPYRKQGIATRMTDQTIKYLSLLPGFNYEVEVYPSHWSNGRFFDKLKRRYKGQVNLNSSVWKRENNEPHRSFSWHR